MVRILFLCLLLLPLLGQANNKQLIAKVDRQQVEMGDILRFSLVANFSPSDTPNFDRLIDQFDILSKQQGSSFQYINGQLSREVRWDLDLLPKQDGVLMIPPFTLDGVSSQPIKIRVSKPKLSSGKKANFFLDASVDTPNPFVQQEVHYTLRLFYRGQIIDGNLRAPSFHGTLNQMVTNQKAYVKQLHGKTYQVFEWKYVLFAQKSGELKITPAQFLGRVQWQGRLIPLRLKSQSLILKVNSQPKTYPKNQPWLPAQKITLQRSLTTQSLTAGDTLPISLTIKAVGLLSAQLPQIPFPKRPGFKVYLDRTETADSYQNGHLVGEKTFHYLLVPTQAGKLTLPEQRLTWWSLPEKSVKMTKTPPQTLTIQPAAQTTPQTHPLVSHETSPATQASVAQQPSTPTNPSIPLWIWGLLIGLLIALTTLFTLWLNTQKQLKRLTQQISEKAKKNPEKSQNSQSCKENINQMTVCEGLKQPQVLQNLPREQLVQFYQRLQPLFPSSEPQTQNAFEQLKRHLFAASLDEQTLQTTLKTLCLTLQKTDKQDKKSHTPKVDKNTHLSPIYPK